MSPRYTRTASLAFAAVVACCLSISAARGEDPFSAAIRPTDAKTPEEERRSFHVPPGFEVQLVAAEPEIQKPMNLAFDARGRLWVSGSTEYPFPAPPIGRAATRSAFSKTRTATGGPTRSRSSPTG